MKKIASLVLTLVMLISLTVPVLAETGLETDPETGELYEEFTFDFGYTAREIATAEGENFNIETNQHTDSEVFGGGSDRYTKIYAKEGTDVIITRIEARVSYLLNEYEFVAVTPGEKREECIRKEDNNNIVHIDNINSNKVEFSGGTYFVRFDLIRVYYEVHEHAWGEDGICEGCGAFKCEITGGHNAVCAYCGKELASPNITASTFSEGSLTIIVGVVGLAVGFFVAMLIFRKRKLL